MRLRFDQRILLLALTAGLPAAIVGLILLWTNDYTPKVQWTLTVFILGVWTGCSFSVRRRVVLPLQTLSNLLAALRESDFSIRARTSSARAASDDPLSAVMLGVAASATVTGLIAVAACPTTNTWFAAEASVGCTTWIVRLSLAFVPPPAPVTTSCR